MQTGINNSTQHMLSKVPFLDLRIQDQRELKYLQNLMQKIARHGRIVNGPEVHEFEKLAGKFLNTTYNVGVGSGSDALMISLLALEIGFGDEVIVPCLSFIGTASAISMVGATPVFVDVGWDLCISPNHIEQVITDHTKAIMPVHFSGKISAMDKIMDIAKAHNLPVIEDAAPAFGAELKGKKAGSWGTIGCFSMNPMKILGALGEAGLVVTNLEELDYKLQKLRYHHIRDKELCLGRGINARLDGIQAAVLSYRLEEIPNILLKRRQIANYYYENLNRYCHLPFVEDISTHVYYTYSILTPHRDKLMHFLAEQGIETKIYHRYLMPKHPLYKLHKQHTQPFTVGDEVTKQILCLPVHEKLTDKQVEKVIDCTEKFFREKKRDEKGATHSK